MEPILAYLFAKQVSEREANPKGVTLTKFSQPRFKGLCNSEKVLKLADLSTKNTGCNKLVGSIAIWMKMKANTAPH